MHRLAAEKTYTGGGAGEENQATEVGCSFITKGASRINQGRNSISLHGTPNDGATPSCRSSSRLLRSNKFLLRVGGLGAVICIAKDRGQDAQRRSVVKYGSRSNSGGLHGG
jgi:hypothetical protein